MAIGAASFGGSVSQGEDGAIGHGLGGRSVVQEWAIRVIEKRYDTRCSLLCCAAVGRALYMPDRQAACANRV